MTKKPSVWIRLKGRFPAAANLTINDLDSAKETIDNIRINDFRPARTILINCKACGLITIFMM